MIYSSNIPNACQTQHRWNGCHKVQPPPVSDEVGEATPGDGAECPGQG